MPTPPKTEQELLDRCHAIAGLTVAELAGQLDVVVPANLRQHKGWLGELVEKALGADAASLSEPDFMALGIELKTLPLNAQGKVQESTWVCTVPLRNASGLRWEDSCVYRIEDNRCNIKFSEIANGKWIAWYYFRNPDGTAEELNEYICVGDMVLTLSVQ